MFQAQLPLAEETTEAKESSLSLAAPSPQAIPTNSSVRVAAVINYWASCGHYCSCWCYFDVSIIFKCNSCCIKNIKKYSEHLKADIQLCSAVSKKEVFKNSSHLNITCRSPYHTVTLWHHTICLKIPVVSPSLYSCK